MQAVVTPAEGTACKGRALEQKAVGRNFSMIMMLTSLVKSLPTTVGEGASLVFPTKERSEEAVWKDFWFLWGKLCSCCLSWCPWEIREATEFITTSGEKIKTWFERLWLLQTLPCISRPITNPLCDFFIQMSLLWEGVLWRGGKKEWENSVYEWTAESDLRGSSAQLHAHAVLVWLCAGGSSTAQCSGT